MRNSSNTIIFLHHIILFPISVRIKYNYFIMEMIYDIKSLIYVLYTASLLSGIFRLDWYTGLISILFFLSFFLCMEVWIVIVYLLSHKIFFKHKQHVNTIPYLILFITIVTGNVVNNRIFDRIPFVGWVGKGICFARDGQWELSIFYLSLLFILIALGYLLGTILIKRVEYDYSK